MANNNANTIVPDNLKSSFGTTGKSLNINKTKHRHTVFINPTSTL